MKAAVLDTQAAAKFSTAAALASKQSGGGGGNRVDWRDSTLATASPPRDQNRPREVRCPPHSWTTPACLLRDPLDFFTYLVAPGQV